MGYYKIDDNILNKQYEIKIGSRHYGQIYYGINKMLLQLQFNVTSIGFQYWITAIQLYQKNYYKYNNIIEKVYNDVAKIHNTTKTRVERAMRTAKATATEQIQKQFNYYNKLTNKKVLELLTNKTVLELKEENEKYKNQPFFDEDKYIENDKIKAKIEPVLKQLERKMQEEYNKYGNSGEYQDIVDAYNFLQSLLEN